MNEKKLFYIFAGVLVLCLCVAAAFSPIGHQYRAVQRELDGAIAERDRLAGQLAELERLNTASLDRVAELRANYRQVILDVGQVRDSVDRLGKLLTAANTIAEQYETIIKQYGRAITGRE